MSDTGYTLSGPNVPDIATGPVQEAPDLGSSSPDFSGGLMPAVAAPAAPGAVTSVTGSSDGSGLLSEFVTTLTSLASTGIGLAAQTGVFGSAAQTAATQAAAAKAAAAKPSTGIAAAVSGLSLTTIVLIIGAVVIVGVLLYVYLGKK